jgi:ABC-type phosphate/phosphonate transport system permease subunit
LDRGIHHRSNKRVSALLKRAKLKYPQAAIEDIDSRPGRSIERTAFSSLALSRWVEEAMTIVVSSTRPRFSRPVRFA